MATFYGRPGRCQKRYLWAVLAGCVFLKCAPEQASWRPDTEWGHWRLGHRSDPAFLRENRFTLTFGSGAPAFENVDRKTFEQGMADAIQFNKSCHDSGYIVLRYLSTSLNGTSGSNKDIPVKDQIHLLDFYNSRWDDYEDYIGPRPAEDPTHWITVRPDGSFPFYRYAPYGRETDAGFETWGCPHHPDYVRMMEGRVRAQAETGIDGSYVDWTQIAGGTCYCPYCRAAFIAYLKENLPPAMAEFKYGTSDYDHVTLPVKRDDDFWMEWLLFRGRSVAQFHHRLRTVARKINPHFMISGNVFGGFGYGPIAYDAAGNMEMLGETDDFIYSEIQEFLDSAPRKREDGTKITNSPALKFLAAACHEKPVIVYATEITPPIFPDPTEKCLSAMAQINIAEAVANHAVFREKRETPPGATLLYRFLADQEKNLHGARLYANIAILASLRQYLADQSSFAFSLSRVMADTGMPHVFLTERDILDSERLRPLDLIVVPYLTLMSRDIQNHLVRYVKDGGQLLLLGTCGIKNEYNVIQNDIPFLSAFQIDEYPDQLLDVKDGKGRILYIPLDIPESRFLIPMQGKGTYTTFGPTMADLFPDIPEAYTRNRIHPQLRAVLEMVTRKSAAMAKPALSQAQNAPYVEMSCMWNRDKKVMLIHLVNYNVTLDGTVTPAEKMHIDCALPAGYSAAGIRYSGELSEPAPVLFEKASTGGRNVVRFQADLDGIYGLAVIDLK